MLLQTFGLAAAQVLATSLNGYYQLCIMLMIFVTGLTVLAHVSPFREAISQHVQVSHGTALPKVHGSKGGVVADILSEGQSGGANTGPQC